MSADTIVVPIMKRAAVAANVVRDFILECEGRRRVRV
jgi:hypothetical protein